MTAVMAAGQTLVIITRNIDLSVGSIAGVTAYLTGETWSPTRPPRPCSRSASPSRIGCVLGLDQRGARGLRADPVDHRHPRDAGDLPDVADQLRRRRARSPPTRCRSGSSTSRDRRVFSIGGLEFRADVRVGVVVILVPPGRARAARAGAAGSTPSAPTPRRPGRRAARAAHDDRRLRAVRCARRARRVPVPGPLRDDHGGRRPGPRAGVDRRRRRRRGQHARRLGHDRRRAARRGADRPARPEPRPRAADQRVLARRRARRCSSSSPSCSTGLRRRRFVSGARSCDEAGADCDAGRHGGAARAGARATDASTGSLRRSTWELLLAVILARDDRRST